MESSSEDMIIDPEQPHLCKIEIKTEFLEEDFDFLSDVKDQNFPNNKAKEDLQLQHENLIYVKEEPNSEQNHNDTVEDECITSSVDKLKDGTEDTDPIRCKKKTSKYGKCKTNGERNRFAIRKQIVDMWNSCKEISEICEKLGCTRQTAWRWIDRYQKEGDLSTRPKTGAPWKPFEDHDQLDKEVFTSDSCLLVNESTCKEDLETSHKRPRYNSPLSTKKQLLSQNIRKGLSSSEVHNSSGHMEFITSEIEKCSPQDLGPENCSDITTEKMSGSDESEISCSITNLPFSERFDLYNLENNDFSEEELLIEENNNFNCNLCDFEASSKYYLTLHKKVLHPSQSPSSDYLNLESLNESEINYENNIAMKEKMHHCTLCDYKAKRPYSVKLHMKTHTSERKFSCELCDYKSARLDTLKTHLKTHTGERDYKCTLCDYTGIKSYNLKEHMKKHDKEPTSKMEQCNLCEYKANDSYSLKIHMKVHRNVDVYEVLNHDEEKKHQCVICGYKTEHKSNFNKHVKIHTGEKLFNCDICEYKTSHKYNYTQHLKTHNGEKNIECSLCDYKATHKRYLNRHLQTHATDKTTLKQLRSELNG